ncbi:MAG: B12-binding domain-containing radical SAM protein [Nitrospinota bacterium]
MANVVLIHPKAGGDEVFYAPLAMMALAAYIEKDHSVEIIDDRLEGDLFAKLDKSLSSSPEVVGLTALTGGQILRCLKISEYVKKHNPRTSVVWGGVFSTYFPHMVLENSWVDFVVLNEGEQTLQELLTALEGSKNYKDIRGLAYKENGKITENPRREFLDMDTLPMPAWHLIDVPKYIEKLGLSYNERPLNIATTRGCPFRCKFCYNTNFNLRTWRKRSPELVLKEISLLYEKYGINHLVFHDDLFTVDKKRALRISKMVREKEFKLSWTVTHRANQFDPKFLSELRKMGRLLLRVGAESGSAEMLNSIYKDITVESMLKAAKVAREAGVDVIYSFVMGWPGETEEHLKETIGLMFKLQEVNPDVSFYPLWIYIPYPGTPLYEEALKRGFIPPKTLEDWGQYSWDRVKIPWIEKVAEKENMHQLSRIAFSNRKTSEIFRDKKSGGFLKPNIVLRRMGIIVVRSWARFRFRCGFWFFPYEYRLINSILRRI